VWEGRSQYRADIWRQLVGRLSPTKALELKLIDDPTVSSALKQASYHIARRDALRELYWLITGDRGVAPTASPQLPHSIKPLSCVLFPHLLPPPPP
jgi:hypothetical protein